jgi:SynChlorMet cassette radical SAM/SPASM protein ScmF
VNEDEKKFPELRTVYLYATGACNLKCSHCWINPEFQEAGYRGNLHIDPVLVEKMLVQGKPLGLSSFKITGGEPLLHPSIKRILSFLSDEGMKLTMETNGTLIDEDMAGFLASCKELGFMSVSLDGADAITHEKLRGVEGSFNSAIQGIRNLVSAGIRPQMICTLHRENSSQMRKIIDLAESLGCGSVKFNHVQYVGRGSEFDTDLLLTVPEILELNNIIESEIIHSTRIRVLLDVPFAFYTPARFLRGSRGRCNILNIIGLLSNGDLALCGIGTSVEELVYGNVGTDDLEEVWENSPGLARLRETVPDGLEGICSKCVHRRFCMGTCVAGNYNATGRLSAPYYFCSISEELGLFPASRKR